MDISRDERKKMDDVLYEYFEDKWEKYFTLPDLINEGDAFIRYKNVPGARVIISIGNNDGEFQIKVCCTAEELKQTIEFIIR